VPPARAVQGQGREVRGRGDPAQGRQEEVSGKTDIRERRRERLRFQLRHKGGGRPRLSVFRSSKHIYAQVIDDAQGKTVAAASSLDKGLREAVKAGELKTGADKAAAAAVGRLVAERALAAGVTEVVF